MSDFEKNNKIEKTLCQILDKFIDVCEKYHLRWCLAYGSIIGAVRDGGLIPWDHDVDVWMPYEDYIKLFCINLRDNVFKDEFYLADYLHLNKGMRNFKLIRRGTTLSTRDHIVGRMFMDIYPIFRSSTEESTIKEIKEYCTAVKKNLIRCIKNNNIRKFQKTIFYAEKEIYDKYNTNEDKRCSFDLECLINYNYEDEEISIERVRKYMRKPIDFDNTVEVGFRGISKKVKIPKNFDDILREIYGDYMTPVVEGVNDWVFDTERDSSYYIKTKTLPKK